MTKCMNVVCVHGIKRRRFQIVRRTSDLRKRKKEKMKQQKAGSLAESAFESRLSPLTAGQKKAYSYLIQSHTGKDATKAEKKRVASQREAESKPEPSPSVNVNSNSSAFSECQWAQLSKRRNSVLGVNRHPASVPTEEGRQSPAVCKELVDLDLHSSFNLNGNDSPRDRLHSEYIPRPGNPLATLFDRQCRTPEPSLSFA